MSAPILATKLYIPPPRPKVVPRPRLIERLNAGLALGCRLTLITAPAGFGKTTLVSEWLAPCEQGDPAVRAAWLSLDAADSAATRFLAYLVAALQTLFAGIGSGVLAALQSPQPPPIETLLTALLNEIAATRREFILVLDDYHLVDAKPVSEALTFLLEHQPPQMRLVIATREDPQLPLARLRGRGQMTELRAADLRFTPAEAADFLNQVMGLNLSAGEIAALETRTEGWIAGLQMAALSMQGHQDTAGFIKSFTGSHHFVLDYLVEEVLQRQTAGVQAFLLRTSILSRMCGPLCDAVLAAARGQEIAGRLDDGQTTLEYLERANLFVVPLDDERRWYRYHHLFAELLRQRLQQSAASSSGHEGWSVAELHARASQWFEDNDLMLEAFRHAAAAHDIERAERLIKGGAIAMHLLTAVTAIVAWLDSLPKTALDARPWLWARSATSALMSGQVTGVEEKLRAAEAALAATTQGAGGDDEARDLVGQIASVRATLAVLRYDADAAILQVRRALEYLGPDNPPARARAVWALGFAHQLRGDRAAARQAYGEAMAIPQTSGNVYFTIMATTGLGQIQESDNQLHQAAESYRRSLQMFGDGEPPNASEEFLGLARICYEWNDLDAAEQYGRQSVELARQYDPAIDRVIMSQVFVARVRLARGDVAGAAVMLAEAQQSAQQRNFTQRLPEIAAVQVLTLLRQGTLPKQGRLLRQGHLAAAAQLAQAYELPLSQARVHLAQGNPSAALAVLEPYRRHVEARNWPDERLRAMVLQAVALRAAAQQGAVLQVEGEDEAVQLLGEALALAEPGGFIRLFVDEGPPMAQLLSEAAARGMMPDYTARLLAAFEGVTNDAEPAAQLPPPVAASSPSSLVEPLSQRELEILKLITEGLTNREIADRLFLALDTVKGHNRRIFDKLQVESRTEAIARARELGLL